MISKLLELVPWYWRWAALAVAFVACFGYGWVRGSAHEEQALDDFRAGVSKAYNEQVVRQAERKRLSDEFTKGKDERHAVEKDEIRDYWARYVKRMRDAAGAGAGAEPVRITSTICNDSARDQQLSGALTVARSEFREAIAEYRAGLGGLFAACQVQTADLVDVQEWAIYQQLLNQQPKKDAP